MINRLSHSRLGNISFIALVTISYFVPRSLRSLVTKYDIVSRAIKLISPRLSYDNLCIHIYMCVACSPILSANTILIRGHTSIILCLVFHRQAFKIMKAFVIKFTVTLVANFPLQSKQWCWTYCWPLLE